ncbi:unnamed protein product [Cochlearia groenlandica]
MNLKHKTRPIKAQTNKTLDLIKRGAAAAVKKSGQIPVSPPNFHCQDAANSPTETCHYCNRDQCINEGRSHIRKSETGDRWPSTLHQSMPEKSATVAKSQTMPETRASHRREKPTIPETKADIPKLEIPKPK